MAPHTTPSGDPACPDPDQPEFTPTEHTPTDDSPTDDTGAWIGSPRVALPDEAAESTALADRTPETAPSPEPIHAEAAPETERTSAGNLSADTTQAPRQSEGTLLDYVLTFITTRIHSGAWTYYTFPTQDELRDQLRCGRRMINGALNELERRRLLFRQAVRGKGSPRLLPAPPGRRPFPASTAAMIAEDLIEGIVEGKWAGVDFPTIYQTKDEFGCSVKVASEAMRVLAAQGWVHRITVDLKDGGRGWRWVPVDVAPRGPEEISREIERVVRNGVLTGLLPNRDAMAAQHHVRYSAVARAYQRLQDDGLIGFGWLPDLSTRGWFVLKSAPPGLMLCQSKGLAFAALLRMRISDWLIRGPRDQWYRSKLPTVTALAQEHKIDYRSAERAVAVLEQAGVVERGPFAAPVYLPVPPTPGTAPDMRFHFSSRKPGNKWAVCRHTQRWRPLPACDDDPLVVAIDIKLGYRSQPPDSSAETPDDTQRPAG